MADQERLPNPWPGIIAVIIHMAMMAAAFSMLATLNSLWLERWGAPAWLIGIGGALPLAANLLTIAILLPRMRGRIKPVTTVALGCAWGVAMVALMPFAHEPLPWLALRFLCALGLGFSWLIGESWINLAVPPALRGRIVATYASAFFAGFAVGPQVVRWVGIDGLIPIAVTMVTIVGATMPLVLAWRYAPPMQLEGKGGATFLLHRARPVAIAALVAGLTEAMAFALLINYGLRAGLPEPAALSLMTWFVLGGLALQFPIGWAADRWSKRGMLMASGLVTIACVGVLPALIGGSAAGPAVFALGGLVLAFYSLGISLMGDQVSARDMILANASFLTCYQIGGLSGPALAGLAMEIWPPHGWALSVGLASFALAVVVWLTRRAAPA
jgi:MFS family permease